MIKAYANTDIPCPSTAPQTVSQQWVFAKARTMVRRLDRDTRSIARARTRVAEAGLKNVIFTQSDVRELPVDRPFDAVVGRFILQFPPDPVVALQSMSQLVRPGGIVAFQEPCWTPILPLAAHLPLWAACASLIRESLEPSGVNTEMGLALYRTFLQAGLPAPTLQMEIPVGENPAAALWIYDLLHSAAADAATESFS